MPESIYKLELHEQTCVQFGEEFLYVMRVVGGWIYGTPNCVVFVPQPQPKPKPNIDVSTII